MRIIDAGKTSVLHIGYLGEKDRTQVRFFFGDIKAEFPGGVVVLTIRRPWETEHHDITPVIDGDWAIWTVGEYDLAVRGEGECQLIYSDGVAVCKRKVWETRIGYSIEGKNVSIPPDWEDIKIELVTAAGTVVHAIEEAQVTISQDLADAVAAKEAAEAAQGKAEQAQQGAEAARAGIIAAKEAAEAAQEKAETAYGKAETSQRAAETAQEKAEQAQEAAEAAQNAAEDAQDKAETAQGKAETAEQNAKDEALKAEGHAEGKQNGVDVDSQSTYYHKNAKYYSEQAAASAQSAGESAGAAAASAAERIAEINAAGQTQIGLVAAKGTEQVGAVGNKGAEQVAAVAAKGTEQVTAVGNKGAEQVAAVAAKGVEVLESIPSDYSSLSAEVSEQSEEIDNLKNAIDITPVAIITGYDELIPTDGSNNGSLVSASGSIISVYDVSNYKSITVQRPQSSTVGFLVSDTLYKQADMPKSGLTCVSKNGQSYEYTPTKKYLYLVTARSSNYSASISANVNETIDKLKDYVIENCPTFIPVTEITNYDMSIPSDGAAAGSFISNAGSVISVYDVGWAQNVKVSRPLSSDVAFIISDTLYEQEDMPKSGLTCVKKTGTEINYTPTKKYLYIVTKRSTEYSASVEADVFSEIGTLKDRMGDIEKIEAACSPVSKISNASVYLSSSLAYAQIVSSTGWEVSVYDISVNDVYKVIRPNPDSVVFALSNSLFTSANIPVTDLDRVVASGKEYIFNNAKQYKYLYVNSKASNDANYTIKVLSGEFINSLKMQDLLYPIIGDLDYIPTNIVCTYGSKYVSNNNGILKYSEDKCKTWKKNLDVSAVGLIQSYHLFEAGGIAFFTHTKAYYSDDWTTYHEASVYEQDGITSYSPSQYDNFFQTKEILDRKFVDGQELYVFGNYGITDEANTRRIIWFSNDNGHSYKIIYEFNLENTIAIRHVHTVAYNPNFDAYLCLTGDSAGQSHVIEFTYDEDTGIFTHEILGSGLDYKWAGIAFYGEEVYYTHDTTPGSVLKCKYKDINDISKRVVVLDSLPNDCIGLFIGQRGDILVTLSNARSYPSYSPFNAYVDCRKVYYSKDRENFTEIYNDILFKGLNALYYGFFSPNSDGVIVSGILANNVNIAEWGKMPSISLDTIVKRAGFFDAFKPYDTNYEIIPVTSIACDDEITVAEDATIELNAVIFPYNATVKTWEVAEYDPNYVHVSGHEITGWQPGETEIVIRAKSNNAKKTVKVTVT